MRRIKAVHEARTSRTTLEIKKAKPRFDFGGLTKKKRVAKFGDLERFCPDIDVGMLIECINALPAFLRRFKDDKQLLKAPTSRFNCIRVPVREFQTAECQFQTARASGNETWHSVPP